jgi:hypothetical protein
MREKEHGTTALEALADDEFARLEHDLRGALINRQEIVFVGPESPSSPPLRLRAAAGPTRSFSAL